MVEVKNLYTTMVLWRAKSSVSIKQTKIYFEAFFNSAAFVLNRLSPKHFQNALM